MNHVTGDVHFLSILLRKRKTVLTVHDFVSVHRLTGVRKRIFLLFWYWLPMKRVRVVTVVSESVRQEVLQHIKVPPGKVRVIHDCVSRDFVCKPLQWDSAAPVILFVGSTPNKNLPRVARALRGITCRLRIVGLPTDREQQALREQGVEITLPTCDLSNLGARVLLFSVRTPLVSACGLPSASDGSSAMDTAT